MNRAAAPLRLVLTCEHGGHGVPAALRARFRGHRDVLTSHRGWDLGALVVARQLARAFAVPLQAATTSRLVVDLNRSPDHPRVVSEFLDGLTDAERRRLLARLHRPHRQRVEQAVARLRRRGAQVLHIGVHSFTPVLDGVERRADIGLLFDPARRPEAAFYRRWKRGFAAAAPDWKVLANHPYRGTSDGLTTALRRQFPRGYLGFELELNQRLFGADRRTWRRVGVRVVRALAAALEDSG
ncbi:MAG: N-formylglutamate amidohydrolase [Planctomycetes bacterium]|nr:N-formylglutamate amidohydrolase [Planctomycetota bacterium]